VADGSGRVKPKSTRIASSCGQCHSDYFNHAVAGNPCNRVRMVRQGGPQLVGFFRCEETDAPLGSFSI